MSVRGSDTPITQRSDISTKGQRTNVPCQHNTLRCKLRNKPPLAMTARGVAVNYFFLDGNRRLRESIPSAPGRHEGVPEVIGQLD